MRYLAWFFVTLILAPILLGSGCILLWLLYVTIKHPCREMLIFWIILGLFYGFFWGVDYLQKEVK